MCNLEEQSRKIRALTLESIHSIGTGHVGGSLSIADVLTCLYYGGLMRTLSSRGWKDGTVWSFPKDMQDRRYMPRWHQRVFLIPKNC